jgi:AraC-like DNA-binding protein
MEMAMIPSALRSPLPSTPLVPATCDAEAGGSRYVELQIRSAISELCSAVWSALDNERSTAENSLRRAIDLLKEMGEAAVTTPQDFRGRLAPWQVRKVTGYINAHLDQTIRNDELAAIARLHTSYFGRAFRNSLGETPHEYIMRRRIEHAQGLMLSTGASLSEIALDCGLADQSHLSRLFRRLEGESPSAWRRARLGSPDQEASP